jgi:hypothetical protein
MDSNNETNPNFFSGLFARDSGLFLRNKPKLVSRLWSVLQNKANLTLVSALSTLVYYAKRTQIIAFSIQKQGLPKKRTQFVPKSNPKQERDGGLSPRESRPISHVTDLAPDFQILQKTKRTQICLFPIENRRSNIVNSKNEPNSKGLMQKMLRKILPGGTEVISLFPTTKRWYHKSNGGSSDR